MNTDLYVGLTTLEAGVFAIFAAALFVLIQAATDIFTPITPSSLLRRKEAYGAVGLTGVLIAVGVLAAVRAAFPYSEVFPGDQNIGPVVDRAGVAYLLAFAILGSIALNAYVLVKLIGDFRGPGMVDAVASEASIQKMRDWLDFIEPPAVEYQVPLFAELRRIRDPSFDEDAAALENAAREERNRQLQARLEDINKRHKLGELIDPLGPILEISARSIEARRYALVDRCVIAVRDLTDRWLRDEPPIEARRLLRLLNSHFGDLVEIGIHTGSYSQVALIVRTLENIALDSLARAGHEGYPILVSEELALYAKRLSGPEFRPQVTDIINSIHRITEATLNKNDYETYEQCLLRLARISEMLAPRYEPEVGIHILERNLATRQDQKPEDALYNVVEWLVRQFTENEHVIPHSLVFTVDALEVSALAFLAARGTDQVTAAYVANYVGIIGQLALTATKSLNGDALSTTVLRLQSLVREPNFFAFEAPARVVADILFETGLILQANLGKIEFKSPIGTTEDVLMWIVDIVSACPQEAIQKAVTENYRRGRTTAVPDPIQKIFKECIDAKVGHVFLARDGRP